MNTHIIFDFDGVIVDSNLIKYRSIYEASRKIFPDKDAKSFAEYFVGNNGIGRKEKCKFYFSNSKTVDTVLKYYESILEQEYKDAPLTKGCHKTFNYLDEKGYDYSILSGGSKKEILEYIDLNLSNVRFKKIMCDELSKNKWLDLKNEYFIYDPNIKYYMIGDSNADLKSTLNTPVKFIYMETFSQEPMNSTIRKWKVKIKYLSDIINMEI